MPAIAPVTIAGLARLSGVDVESIRNYEALGLVPKPRRCRGWSGDVAYHGEHLQRLWVIRRALALGFTLPAIGDLLGVKGQYRTCGDIYAIAQRTLESIRASGAVPPRDLERLLDDCPRRGAANDCPLLIELARPVTKAPHLTAG